MQSDEAQADGDEGEGGEDEMSESVKSNAGVPADQEHK